MIAFLKLIPLRLYVYAAIALTIVGLAWYGDHQRNNYRATKLEYEQFMQSIAAAGEQAKKGAARQAAADQRNKERADAERARNTVSLNRELVRLRANNASRGFVPPAPANSSRPDLAAFDRGEFDRALRAFDAGAIGLAGEGAANTVDLDAAKRWAQGR